MSDIFLESLARWWDWWEIIIKSEKNNYLNKIDDRIDKLMWVFFFFFFVKMGV